MRLFLVKGNVHFSEYMNERDKTLKEIRLVNADNKEQAEEKFKKFFNDKTEEYSVYYSCYDAEATEVID